MSKPQFNVNDKFIVTISEVYHTTRDGTPNGRKSEEYVYRMRGDIPLMRERQLKLLERVKNDKL